MADYAISNVARRVVYANTGVGPYAFTFEILANTDIAVYRGSTLLTLTTDYSVTINANGTGSITLVTAGTGNITIVGARAIQRTSDYTTGGDLFASTLNTDLDSQTIYVQQVAETAERGLKAPVVDPTDINMTLPAKATRAGTVLAFDSPSGNPVAGPTIASVGTVLGNIANINTVAGSISNVNTVATNISNVNTVAGISGNVTTVANNNANITTVADDLNEPVSEINTVATNIANVNTVGNNIANVNTVAGISANVTSVAGNATNINTVAGISSAVTNVSSISSAVSGVDSNSTNINTVAGQISPTNNVATVAGIASNVSTVAGISANVTTVAGISGNVTTVAGISGNVTTVAGISGNVTTVAGISANVTTVAGISSAVTTVATNVVDVTNYADTYLGPKASDPATRNDSSALQAGDLYFNTADDVMKVYSGSAWLAAYASLAGALIAANNLSDLTNTATARTNLGLGSSDSPTFTGITASGDVSIADKIIHTGDTNTAIRFPAADTITAETAGAERLRIDSSGNVGVALSNPNEKLAVSGNFEVRNDNTDGYIWFHDPGTHSWSIGQKSTNAFVICNNSNLTSNEYLRIRDSGNVSIGTSNIPSNRDSVTPKFVVNGAGVAGSMQVVRNTTPGAGGAIIGLSSTRGTDVNSYTVLQSGDGIGSITFGGADGDQFVRAASIACQVDGTPGDNDMPGRIIFNTTSDGASTDTERMRINSSGNVGIGTSSYSEKLSLNGNVRLQTNAKTRIEYLNSTGAYSLGVTGGAAVAFEEISGSHELAFETHWTGNSHAERMRITKEGNVQLSTANTSILNSSGRKILNQTGSILQVIDGTYATQTSTSSTSFVTTNISASITPSSTSSKILVICNIAGIAPWNSTNVPFTIYRGATNIAPSGSGTDKNLASIGGGFSGSRYSIAFSYLDSPASTSSLTYAIYFASPSGNLQYIQNDSQTSSIQLLEISG